MKSEVDDLPLQRLVDGEMSDEERCRVLTSLDAHPQLWRTLALAFVEEQLWGGELRRDGAAERLQPQYARTPRPAANRSRRWALTIAVAAALLATLGLGYQIGRQHGAPATVAESRAMAAPDDSQTTESAAVGTAADRQAAPYRLQLLCRGGDREQSLELPVYDESELTEVSWRQPDVRSVEQLNRDLAGLGCRVDSSTEYLSRDLSGGKRLLVPLQTVAVRYHGQ